MRDFKRLQQDPPAGISGAPQDNNIMLWNAVIFGPDDTPWDGGSKARGYSEILLQLIFPYKVKCYPASEATMFAPQMYFSDVRLLLLLV
ncbi:unnamed protein product [Coffea canephora]|uniref:UBC core domain-containing protein n=1 Tax=Coffea canephora TaxID=49390 RepID=A0A068V2V8_COFCA|nr:unnamed protein product [Coffea canephora]